MFLKPKNKPLNQAVKEASESARKMLEQSKK